MFNPSKIIRGKIYDVKFGDQTKAVCITGRTGIDPEHYRWKGTLVTEGIKVHIKNSGRFVGENTSPPTSRPWLIAVDSDRSLPEEGNSYSHSLLLSIREQESYRWVACMPSEPLEFRSNCAEVIRNAIRICRSGPPGSDAEHLHFFDIDNHVPTNISVGLTFDLWDPVFANEEYFAELLRRINAAKANHQKSKGIKDDFLPNTDGLGAVYWTEKTGIVKVLWPDSIFLKSLYLQSEEDIRNFAESLFGEHGHSFEELRQLLDAHEGEWFDPPENFAYYSSYRAEQFSSLYLGILPLVYEGNDEEGVEYYGWIVCCEDTSTCPDVLNWTPIENKAWLRTNEGADREYSGPYENPTQAAREVYEQYFQ